MNTQRDQAWHCTHDEWSAEASSLQINAARRCPKCGERLIARETFLAVRDSENEITHWVGTHSCGARLTIFND